MSNEQILTILEAKQLASKILTCHKVSAANSHLVTDALVAAEIDGQPGHGLSRLPSYSAQAASGKVDGMVAPVIIDEKVAAVRIDARYGFAYPALELARAKIIPMARKCGVAVAAIVHSHHFGQAGYHVEKIAEQGLIALLFGNSPKAIAPWGGSSGLFGTNPIGFAAPQKDAPPLVIDLSLSKVARGKIMVAANNKEPIPQGWALDPEGNPTTDPQAALAGTMLPIGDAKGAALVLMVEIMAAALTGANFGFEAESFFTPEGNPPGVGQVLLAFDPTFFSGDVFTDRMETLVQAILGQEGTRLPGTSRLARRTRAQKEGIAIPDNLYAQLVDLAE